MIGILQVIFQLQPIDGQEIIEFPMSDVDTFS
jgi:hypothetical protein